jgi:hypothetical protein
MATSILSVALAAVCLASSVADFKLVPRIVEAVARLGLPTRIVPVLGVAKAAGGLGLLVGLANDDLQIFTALCVTVYFGLATFLHLRVKDSPADTAPAGVLFGLALATFITAIG